MLLHGPDITPDGTSPERNSYSDVVLVERLRDAIGRFNPDIPAEAREEAFKKVLRTESPDLINNHNFHKMAADYGDIEYRRDNGSIAGDKVWLFDFENPKKNEFLAVGLLNLPEK